jgi:hypothetical protein
MIVLQQASWLCSLLFSIEMVELCFSAHFALHRDLTLYVCDKTTSLGTAVGWAAGATPALSRLDSHIPFPGG